MKGTNVRVYTVDTKVFATAVSTDATDYRYAYRQVGNGAALKAIELSEELAERCVRLSQALGLAFAGVAESSSVTAISTAAKSTAP